MAFKRIRRSDRPLSLQWKRPPIDLGSEEPSCTRWSVRAPLSPSESVAFLDALRDCQRGGAA
jgi:hypothetical protein